MGGLEAERAEAYRLEGSAVFNPLGAGRSTRLTID